METNVVHPGNDNVGRSGAVGDIISGLDRGSNGRGGEGRAGEHLPTSV